jgi:DNA-binding protein HU-beta
MEAVMAEAYKGHREGSSKGKVHQVFDTKGRDAAMAKAKALGIMESTARTWTSAWARGGTKKKSTVKRETPAKKPAAKKAPAKTAKKTAKKSSVKRAAPAKKAEAAQAAA